MKEREPIGVLCIGDPHLAARSPGHRKDDYPQAILAKLRWCLEYAQRERLVPVILGDLFHVPRDNGNALVVDLLGLLPAGTLAIVGNHDVGESGKLDNTDTLAVLVAAGKIRLVSGGGGPWSGRIGGRAVAIGGTDWGTRVPETIDRAALGIEPDALVLWLTHHDVRFKGYEEAGRFEPLAVEGVDIVVNGHIHRPLEQAKAGATTWLNPGNIARVKRGEGSRRAPAVLRIDIGPGKLFGWRTTQVEVPHGAYDDVFHAEEPADAAAAAADRGSAFVASLAALTERRTSDGQNLVDFLDSNLARYPATVADEVRRLSKEVLDEPLARRTAADRGAAEAA